MGSHPPFAVTVDLVVLTIRNEALNALMIQRGEEPYAGQWALPGGFVHEDEDLDDAAVRELDEETGLSREDVHLEQLATFGAPRRDPRQRVVTVAYLALAPDLPAPRAGSDAADASWRPAGPALTRKRLAFDHAEILAAGIERARAKLEYTPLATAFCQSEFTITELRRVYEAVWGAPLDPRNFHRKVTKTDGFLAPTEHTTTRDGGRPARLYRSGDIDVLHPPLLRTGGSL